MADTLRNMPRYIRNTDAFGWQGADGPDGPWRSITPPQSGAPWQTISPMDALHQANAEVSGAEVLSSAAKAVLDAAYEEIDYIPQRHVCWGAAAALRAVADQVVPKTPPPKFAPHYEEGIWDGKEDARDHLLAIANELENYQ